jgi:hypothetical protein
VLQAWWLANGRRFDVVVGVRKNDGFAAHAWLDGLEDVEPDEYVPIHRLACR